MIMQYENIDSAEMAELALSQAVDEHIEKSKEAIDRISELEQQILHWNQEDIRKLRNDIQELRELLKKNFQVQIENFIHMRSIPGMRVPEEIRQLYKIISVDKKGFALYGTEMNKIAHITKITEHFKKRKEAAAQVKAKVKK